MLIVDCMTSDTPASARSAVKVVPFSQARHVGFSARINYISNQFTLLSQDEQVFCGRIFFAQIGYMILLRRAWMDWSIKMAIAIWVADVPIWQLAQTVGRIR